MLDNLKRKVYEANMLLPQYGLVTFTWGNVSGFDRDSNSLVIKPSGVPYEELHESSMVVVDVKTGDVIEGTLKPSADAETHRRLYLANPEIGGIVHTHSTFATVWAQSCMDLPALGTTHGDDFYGDIPCTRALTSQEITDSYEWHTGEVIVETFRERNISLLDIPSVLIASHGPFTWAKNPLEAVKKAVILEEVAKIAYHTRILNPCIGAMNSTLLDKHFMRKHGKNAYYGQDENTSRK